MDKSKRVSAKGRAFWLLRKQHDDLYSMEYKGPDKAKARDKAQTILESDPKAELIVGKVGGVTVLRSDDLRAQLPRDSF